MLLTVGLIVTVLLLIGLVGYFYINDADWSLGLQIFGFILSAFISLIVFGVVAVVEIDYYKFEEIQPKSISRSQDAVFVQFKNMSTRDYYLKSEYDNIDSNTIFLVRTSYNYYGYEIKHKNIKYYLDKKESSKLLNKKIYE